MPSLNRMPPRVAGWLETDPVFRARRPPKGERDRRGCVGDTLAHTVAHEKCLY